MNSISTNAARSPHLTRRKRPIRHGVYLRSNQRALEIRAVEVKRLMRTAVNQMAWLREENLPTLRKWAELEVIRRAAFAGIVQDGVFSTNQETGESSLRRLVDDHRKLTMSQLVLERELLMTPAAHAQLSSGEQSTDLVSLMARASEAETAEPAEAESEPPVEDPPDEEPARQDPVPPKESPTEPGQPAPMKSA